MSGAARHRRRDSRAAAADPGRDSSRSGRCGSRAPAGSRPRRCRAAASRVRMRRRRHADRRRAHPNDRRCVVARLRRVARRKWRTLVPEARPVRPDQHGSRVRWSRRPAAPRSASGHHGADRRSDSPPPASPRAGAWCSPACRGRRRWRSGRHGWDSWRARSRPAAPPPAWRRGAPRPLQARR